MGGALYLVKKRGGCLFKCFTMSSQSSLAPRPHPTHAEEKGSGVTNPSAWASPGNMERPIKSQNSVYWNKAEARTSTSIIPLKACH